MRPQRYPRNLEREYTKTLLGIVSHVEDTARSEIEPVLKRAVAQASSEHGDSVASRTPVGAPIGVLRLDASSAGEVRAAIQRARSRLAMTLPDAAIHRVASAIGHKVRAHADQELADQIKSAFGVNALSLLARKKPKAIRKDDDESIADLVDPFVDDATAAALLAAFIDYNISLVQSIPRTALDQLERLLIADLLAGKRASDLAADISDRFGVSESRAALIAQSQVSAFFGQVTRVRQTALGIDSFSWETANDERVRETHAAVQGQVFRWDDPPPGTVDATMIPGSEPRCRCIGAPALDDLIDSIDD